MITLMKMRPEDAFQVAELEKMCFSTPWSEKSIASELENDLALWLVAVENATVVGYVGSQTVCGETDMMNVAVHPNWRRKGIAEQLIHRLITDLNQMGSTCLSLEVRASNAPAIALYQKLDFRVAGRRPNYYRNPKEDALILRKKWEV